MTTMDAFRHAVWITLLTSAPVLLTAMAVGLIIGILQTATSIQEQTLIFIPKILAVFLALLFFGPWMFGNIGQMARDILGHLDSFVP